MLTSWLYFFTSLSVFRSGRPIKLQRLRLVLQTTTKINSFFLKKENRQCQSKSLQEQIIAYLAEGIFSHHAFLIRFVY